MLDLFRWLRQKSNIITIEPGPYSSPSPQQFNHRIISPADLFSAVDDPVIDPLTAGSKVGWINRSLIWIEPLQVGY